MMPSFAFIAHTEGKRTVDAEILFSNNICSWCNWPPRDGEAFRRCRGRDNTVYCSRECQVAAWRTHRQVSLDILVFVRCVYHCHLKCFYSDYSRVLCRSRNPGNRRPMSAPCGYVAAASLGQIILYRSPCIPCCAAREVSMPTCDWAA